MSLLNRRQEGNVLFNDVLNTFMVIKRSDIVKDHSEQEKKLTETTSWVTLSD